MTEVTFRNRGIDVAGVLRTPPAFDPDRRHPALVCVHPGNGVKEQTAGLYASRMAERGYVTLAFDASYQGASGGEPRGLEDTATRVEDVRCAVDLLNTVDFVDDGRIGALGVCAGSGYAVNAAMTDHRIAAVGVVSPINIGRARRESGALTLLDELARQRTAEARGAAPRVEPWLPAGRAEADAAGLDDPDLLEAIDYYQTGRGAHPRSANRQPFVGIASVLGFDAFHLAEELLTQPLQIVVGDRVGRFGSYRDGFDLMRRAVSASSRGIEVVAGAGHYDLYDRPGPVGQAVDTLHRFYDAEL